MSNITTYESTIYCDGYKYTVSFEEGMVVFRYFEDSDDFKEEKMKFSIQDAEIESLFKAANIVAENSEYF